MADQDRLDGAIEVLLNRFKGSGIAQFPEFKELDAAYTELRDPGDLASS